MIRLGRGDIAGAEEDRAFHLDQGRRIKDPQRLLPGLAVAAVHRLMLGDKVEAQALAEEALELARAHIDMAVAANHLILVAGQLGLRDEYLEIVEQAPEGPWKDLSVAGARAICEPPPMSTRHSVGRSFEALARLFGGEELIAQAAAPKASQSSSGRLTFYRSVGATFFVQRGEALLAHAATG